MRTMIISKAVHRLVYIVYAVSIVFAIGTLFYPVESIKGLIGLHFTYFYALCILVGSIGVLIGLAKPNYKVERLFLWFTILGFIIYDLSLWALFVHKITHPLPDQPAAYGPALLMLIIPLFMLRKIIFINSEEKILIRQVDNNGSI